jgi:hypothetical protein
LLQPPVPVSVPPRRPLPPIRLLIHSLPQEAQPLQPRLGLTRLPPHRLLLRLPIHLLQLLLLLRSVRELLVQLTRLLPPPPQVSPRQPRFLIHSPLQVPHLLRPSVLQLAQLIRLLLPPLH